MFGSGRSTPYISSVLASSPLRSINSGGGLHAKGEFISGDAAGDLRIANLGVAALIELHERVEALALEIHRDARRIFQVQNGLALIAEQHTRVGARQEAALPKRRAAAGATAAVEHDVAGQIPRHAAEAVIQPRTDRGQTKLRASAVQHELAGMVVELIRVQAANHEPVIGLLRHVRQQIAEIHAALAMLRKLARAAHELRGLFADEGKAHVLRHAVRQRLAVQFIELRLRIEEIHLAGTTFEEDEDAVLRLRREMRRLRQQRIGSNGRFGTENAFLRQQGAQRERAEAAGGRVEELAACLLNLMLDGMHERECRMTNAE